MSNSEKPNPTRETENNAMAKTLTVPVEALNLDEHVEWILGRPNFFCGAVAEKLRAIGHNIERKAEKEQAYVIHWMLELYAQHGPGFAGAGDDILMGHVKERRPKTT